MIGLAGGNALLLETSAENRPRNSCNASRRAGKFSGGTFWQFCGPRLLIVGFREPNLGRVGRIFSVARCGKNYRPFKRALT